MQTHTFTAGCTGPGPGAYNIPTDPAVPTPPLTRELRRLEGLSTRLDEILGALESRLTQVLPLRKEGETLCEARDSYGVPYADFASESNDRIERQIKRIQVLLEEIAI